MCAMLGAVLGAVGGIAGGMMQAAGAQQQAEAEAQKAQYEAAVARNNATAAAYKSTEEAQAVAQKGEYAIASQHAAYAAAGVPISTGTPVSVMGDSYARIAADVDTAQYEGRITGQRWQDQAVLNEMEAENARKAGKIAAASAIIGGVSSIGKLFGGLGGGGGTALG